MLQGFKVLLTFQELGHAGSVGHVVLHLRHDVL